jgi:hypothetical protein
VLVTVNVELDTTRHRRTEQLLLPAEHESAPAAQRPESDRQPKMSANTAAELPTITPSVSQKEPRPTHQQTWEEHFAPGPKNVTVAITIPEDIAAALTSPRPSAASGAGDWVVRVKDQVAHAIPAGVVTDISVQTYFRPPDPAAANPVSGARASSSNGLAWPAASVLVLLMTLMIGIRGVNRRRTRIAPASAPPSRPAPREATASVAAQRVVGTGDSGRELIRIERSRSRHAPHLAQTAVNSFEDLRRLPPGSLLALFGAVESRLWTPALRGASRELCERILTHMPSRASILLRDEIEYPGPVRLGDVEAAQQEILEVVRRLDHTGDLVLEDREEVRRE